MKRNLATLIFGLFVTTTVFSQTDEAAKDTLPPGWWGIPKTNTIFKFGGYVKTDLIHDFDPIGSPDYFDAAAIPTDGSKGEGTRFNVKETRLKLDVRNPAKHLRAYVEGDFYGSGTSFRIRHAFVEYKGFMAGQYWSNFMDESMIPATLDFEKPAGYIFARQGMVRYKHAINDNSYFAIAIEEPKAIGQMPVEAGKFENAFADITGRYRITKEWGHIQVSGFVGSIRYRYDDGGKKDITLAGGNLSGQFNLFKNDKFIYQAAYGPGLGRYRGGLSVGLDKNGDLEAITDLGLTAGYQHAWSEKFTSLVVYNYGLIENTDGQLDLDLESTSYFAANLIYHIMKGAFFGVEYLRGERVDVGGDKGDANRLQFSFRYSFNM